MYLFKYLNKNHRIDNKVEGTSIPADVLLNFLKPHLRKLNYHNALIKMQLLELGFNNYVADLDNMLEEDIKNCKNK